MSLVYWSTAVDSCESQLYTHWSLYVMKIYIQRKTWHSIRILCVLVYYKDLLTRWSYPGCVPPNKACLPLQLLPFPDSVYPVLQLHWNEPAELVHVCAQPPLLLLHSLMSAQRVVKWRKVMKVILLYPFLFSPHISLSTSPSISLNLPLFFPPPSSILAYIGLQNQIAN